MSPRGNPNFVKGNKEACGNVGGGRKKSDIARMLEQFAPRVVEIIQERLTATDALDRWACAKELMPYLWGKKATVVVAQDGETPSLADYLAVKQNGAPQPGADSSEATESLQ